MFDLPSLVLAIPDMVEAFVKTCRAIETYKNVEKKQKETIVDAIHFTRKLNYYAHFIDHNHQSRTKPLPPSTELTITENSTGNVATVSESFAPYGEPDVLLEDAEELLYDLFKESIMALETAQKVVDEWTLRLHINADDRKSSRLFVARLALSISDNLTGKGRQRDRRGLLAEFRGKTALIIIGCQQIDDAMGRLKHWLRELHDILVASPVLHRRLFTDKNQLLEFRSDSSDDILFVAMARDRERSNRTMETIEPELIADLRPLDDRKGQNFMLIDSKDSPYSDCLVDRRNVIHLLRSQKGDDAIKDTERMAKLFAEEKDEFGHDVSASVGILPCCGFARPVPEYHDLVFRLPPGTRRPRTLRSLLLHGHPQHSLNDRLGFSIKLATAVLIVHSLNLVHKDLRPDSVIVIDPIVLGSSNTMNLGEPYLVAFHASRSMDSATVPVTKLQSAERRWASLYTHPRHLTSSYHRRFEMRDDIYSLGVCLLEIAMWRSLFVWDDTRRIYITDASVCDLSSARYVKMLNEMDEDPNRSQAWFRQADLVRLAEEKIPVTMGDTFKDVVVECLTFGMGKQSISEILKGREVGLTHMKNQSVGFIRNVLSKLRSLRLS